MKRLLLSLLFILLALPASALTVTNSFQGFCEQGGQQAMTAGIASTTFVQASYPGCTVSVYLHGTLTLATIYADGNGTPLANPFTAGNNGSFQFYYVQSPLDATTSGAGIVTPFTFSNIQPPSGGGGSGTVNPGTTNQVALYPTAGTAVSGVTVSGDGSISNTGTLTVISSQGTAFQSAAFQAIGNIGTKVPLENALNTWTGPQDYSINNYTRASVSTVFATITGQLRGYLLNGTIPGTSQYNFGQINHYDTSHSFLDSTPGCWGFTGTCFNTEHKIEDQVIYVMGGGGTNVDTVTSNFWSVGDHIGRAVYLNCFGGSIDGGGPEGCKGGDNFVGEPGDTWTGNVATGHGGSGQTTLVSTCITDCGSSGYGINGGVPASLGQAMWVTDEQATVATGQIMSIANASGETPGTMSVNITGGLGSLAQSTCEATLTSNLNPTPNPSGSGSVSMVFTVNVIFGTCSNGGLMSFAGTNHEQAIIANVTAPSGGQQTITANIRKYHESGSYLFENPNATAGLFADIVANDVGTLKFPVEMLGIQSVSGNTVTFWWRYWYAGGTPGAGTSSFPLGRLVVGQGTLGAMTNTANTVSAQIFQNGFNFGGGTWFGLAGASAIFISNASNSAFNGACLNVTVSFPNNANPGTLTCTQVASSGQTATGANMSLTDATQDNPFGNSRVNFYQGASIVDPQDYANAIVINGVTNYPVDGAQFIVEPNEMPLAQGDLLVEHHQSPQFHGQTDGVGPQQQYCVTCTGWDIQTTNVFGKGFATTNRALGIVNNSPLNSYAYMGGFQTPADAVQLQGVWGNFIDSVDPPYNQQSMIAVTSCPTIALGCADTTYFYNVYSVVGNGGNSRAAYYPGTNTMEYFGNQVMENGLTVIGPLNLSGANSPLQLNGSAGTVGQCFESNGAGNTPVWAACAGGGGTVTQVAMTAMAWISVAGSPITTSGTIALSAATGQTSHQVIGTCGATTSFAPCALVPGDIPTLNQSTTGNAATATALSTTGANNTFWGVSGGTQQWLSAPGAPTWPANNDIVISNGTNTPAGLAPSVNGDCVLVSAGVFTLGNCATASAGVASLNTVTGVVNLVLGLQHTVLGSGTGIVILPTAFGIVDVVNDLGVDSTGTNDVEAPLNTYISSSPNNGTILKFQCGTYKFNSQLTIAATNSTRNSIVFSGTVFAAQRTTSCVTFEGAISNGDIIEYNNTSAGNGNWAGPGFENIGFLDTSTTGTGTQNGVMRSGLHIIQANNTWGHNLDFKNFSGGKYSTGTASATKGSTAVTGASTAWITAHAGPNGMFCQNGNCQEIASVNSGTSLTLVSQWQFASTSGASYVIDFNGVGLLFDGGNAVSGTNFAQYGEWDNINGFNNRWTVATAGSSTNLYGVSRITIRGGTSWCENMPDSGYAYLGGFTDTMYFDGNKENECTWFALLESAHANTFHAIRAENPGSQPPPNTTCPGNPQQSCDRGIEINSDSTNKAYSNTITESYFNEVGQMIQIDSDNVLRTVIANNSFPNGVNSNSYTFLTSGQGYTTTQISNWDRNQTNAALTNNQTLTTVNCATSGSFTYVETMNGNAEKRIVFYLSGCNGAGSFSFPTAFSHTPGVFLQQNSGNALTASLVTALSTTSVTITGTTSTGVIILDGN